MIIVEALRPAGPGDEQSSYFERTLAELAPGDVWAREHAAFELIEPSDPMLLGFIQDTYANLQETTGMAKEEYVLVLATSLFGHAEYLARNFVETRENQTQRLAAWFKNIWVYADADPMVRKGYVAAHLNLLGMRWTEDYGCTMPELGRLPDGTGQ